MGVGVTLCELRIANGGGRCHPLTETGRQSSSKPGKEVQTNEKTPGIFQKRRPGSAERAVGAQRKRPETAPTKKRRRTRSRCWLGPFGPVRPAAPLALWLGRSAFKGPQVCLQTPAVGGAGALLPAAGTETSRQPAISGEIPAKRQAPNGESIDKPAPQRQVEPRCVWQSEQNTEHRAVTAPVTPAGDRHRHSTCPGYPGRPARQDRPPCTSCAQAVRLAPATPRADPPRH